MSKDKIKLSEELGKKAKEYRKSADAAEVNHRVIMFIIVVFTTGTAITTIMEWTGWAIGLCAVTVFVAATDAIYNYVEKCSKLRLQSHRLLDLQLRLFNKEISDEEIEKIAQQKIIVEQEGPA